MHRTVLQLMQMMLFLSLITIIVWSSISNISFQFDFEFLCSIFEDQQVPKKKNQKIDRQSKKLSDSETSLCPSYDGSYHNNRNDIKNKKTRDPGDITFGYKNEVYDLETDRISLDSNDPQYQQISRILPLKHFSPRLDLINTNESVSTMYNLIKHIKSLKLY